jgi:hypothetical protein
MIPIVLLTQGPFPKGEHRRLATTGQQRRRAGDSQEEHHALANAVSPLRIVIHGSFWLLGHAGD